MMEVLNLDTAFKTIVSISHVRISQKQMGNKIMQIHAINS